MVWKTLKRAPEFVGLNPKTPRDTLKEAFRVGWLHDEAMWLDRLDHRNTTSHNSLASELVAKNDGAIASITPAIRDTLEFLKERYAGTD